MVLLLLLLVDPNRPLPDGPYSTNYALMLPPLVLTRIRGPHYAVRCYKSDPSESMAEGRANQLPFGLLDVHYVGHVEPYPHTTKFTVHAVMIRGSRPDVLDVIGCHYYETIRGPSR